MYTALCRCYTESDFNPTFTINVMNPTQNIFGKQHYMAKKISYFELKSIPRITISSKLFKLTSTMEEL